MSDENQTASEIAAAVEQTVEEQLAKVNASTEKTPAEKQAVAFEIYTTWRNQNLRGMQSQAFVQVEAASGALIAAIVAQL